MELTVLHALEAENQLVALIGCPNSGPQARFGVVGLPTKTTILRENGSNLEQALELTNKLQVIALGYELGRNWVHLSAQSSPNGQPPGLVFQFDNALIVDYQRGQYGVFGKANWISQQLIQAAHTTTNNYNAPTPCSQAVDLAPTTSDAQHAQRILKAQEHIAAGDIYQANIARHLHIDAKLNGIEAISALSTLNPVAHGAYIRWGEIEIVSNTMETLFSFEPTTRRIASFPIKGTCERLDNEDSNSPRAQKLLATEKERAEHIMIVDLIRNDLGRICTPGSVAVPRLMGLEGYKGVWHGVSTVEGTLGPQHTVADAIRALFPGGSITGAPKRRSIELIEAIEQEPRGFYTGSIGLIAPNGYAMLSILIRTLIKDKAGWSLGVGGGIVWDSKPEREIRETWEKVSVFQAALRENRKEEMSVTHASDSTGSKTANGLVSKAVS